jgi:hypothetical protein
MIFNTFVFYCSAKSKKTAVRFSDARPIVGCLAEAAGQPWRQAWGATEIWSPAFG